MVLIIRQKLAVAGAYREFSLFHRSSLMEPEIALRPSGVHLPSVQSSGLMAFQTSCGCINFCFLPATGEVDSDLNCPSLAEKMWCSAFLTMLETARE